MLKGYFHFIPYSCWILSEQGKKKNSVPGNSLKQLILIILGVVFYHNVSSAIPPPNYSSAFKCILKCKAPVPVGSSELLSWNIQWNIHSYLLYYFITLLLISAHINNPCNRLCMGITISKDILNKWAISPLQLWLHANSNTCLLCPDEYTLEDFMRGHKITIKSPF